jgi:hypothetical protein
LSEVSFVTSAIRDEAKKWRQLADQLAPIETAVEGLGLSAAAFFIGDLNAGTHSQYYNSYQQFMEKILGQGVVEFEQLAGALDRMANAYDHANAVIELDLNDIYTDRSGSSGGGSGAGGGSGLGAGLGVGGRRG